MTRAATPWHLWAVGVVSLLWNAMGALDYTMTELKNATWLSTMTAEQNAWLDAFPAWAVALWALGVWGAFAGSVLLLARSRFAVAAFAVSFVGLVGTTLYQHNSGMPASLDTAGGAAFSAAIWVVTIGLLIYARAMHRRRIVT